MGCCQGQQHCGIVSGRRYLTMIKI
jgi:hypothetical protein